MESNKKELTKMPHTYVFDRFPKYKETIVGLYNNSPTFREICSDLTEILEWLQTYRPSTSESSANYFHGQELLEELETELADCLKGNHATVSTELNSGLE